MLEILDLESRRIVLQCSENKGADQLCSNCDSRINILTLLDTYLAPLGQHNGLVVEH